MSTYRPVADLVGVLAERVNTWPGRVRVAVDGPPVAEPDQLADEVAAHLRTLGRPAHVVRSSTFWRDRSLRLEYGRYDATAYPEWLDVAALEREVLRPLGSNGAGTYLPTLRDPDTNRVTRDRPVVAPDDAVVLVSGSLLLGRGLSFDRAVHLAVSPPARRRRTPDDWAWALPAFDGYDAEVDPLGRADIVVRLDDPKRPAISA